MAREKEQGEVRPGLGESRSVCVLSPHTCQVCTTAHRQAVWVPTPAQHSCAALRTWGWLQPQQKVLAVDINVKRHQSFALPWAFLPHFPFPIQLLQPPDVTGFKFVPAEPVHEALPCCRHLLSVQSCSLRVCRYKKLSILAPIKSRKKNLGIIFHIMKSHQFLSLRRATRCCQALMRWQSPNWIEKGSPHCWWQSLLRRVKSSCPCSTWSTSKHLVAVPRASFSQNKMT